MIFTLNNQLTSHYDEQVRQEMEGAELYNSVPTNKETSPLFSGLLILAGCILLGTYLSSRKEYKEATTAFGEAGKPGGVKELDFIFSGEKEKTKSSR